MVWYSCLHLYIRPAYPEKGDIMPRAIKKAISKKPSKGKKSVSVSHEMIDSGTEGLMNSPVSFSETRPASKFTQWGLLAVCVLIAVGVYLGSKGYIVAALVDGKPVFRWDLNKALVTRYGQQTLESMISEQLIADAAVKQGVAISQKDIDTKTATVVKSLGPNVKLDDLLKYQGMTKSDFEHQIRLQLTVEKILGKDVAVSDADVDGFIEKNKDTMVATEPAAMRGEAREAVTQQKINEKIQPWFAQLKEKAKVVRLMK